MPRKALTPEEAAANLYKGEHIDLPLVENLPEPALTVEVNIPEEPKEELTLAEKLFGKKSAPEKKSAPPKSRTRGKKKETLFTSVIPTLLTTFIATYSQQLLPDEYKVCAPSIEECDAMFGPICAYLGRRIEVSGEISEDAVDILKTITATVTYGTRALISYMKINEMKRQQQERNVEHARNELDANIVASRDDTRANTRASGNSQARDRARQKAPDGHVDGHTYNRESISINGGGEASIIAELLERDKRGRVRLGLLPGELSEQNGTGS